MMKLVAVLAASAVTAVGISTLADASTKKTTRKPPRNAVTVVAILGPAVKVPAGKFVKAYAYCPKGYFVTGGGAYNGAITEVISGPTLDMRGWFVDGSNTDPLKRTFTHHADAVCAKGSPSVPIAAAASDPAAVRRAELDFLAVHGGTGGR